jgi:hypothetical protein
MVRNVKSSSKDVPIYKSTTIALNDDGTYKVENIFINNENREIIIKYPKVKLILDPMINLSLNIQPQIFPRIESYDVLLDDNAGELFTIEIKDTK